MNYINTLTSAYPVSEGQIRAKYPNTSFGTPFIAPAHYEFVFPAPPPSYNSQTHTAHELMPIETDKGHYEQQWEIIALPEEVVTANVAAATAQFIESTKTQVQSRLDEFAKTRNYDGILSACTYATDTNLKFKTEGQHCVTKRSETWAALYIFMEEVNAGTRPMPTTYAEVEAALPALTWPQ